MGLHMDRADRIRELTEHSDLHERLRSVPPAARIRGLYFKSTIAVLTEAEKLDEYRELFTENYSAMGWFPMTDYLERLAVGAALLTSPKDIDAGLYEIGRSNAAAFAESLLGRMMIRLLSKDPQKLLRQACASRRQSVEYGRWSVEFGPERTAVIHMREEYIWIASNLTGAAKGTFESIGLDASVDYTLAGPYEGTHIIRW